MARQRLCRAGALLPLALVLVVASRAAAQASAPTAAYFVGSGQLSVTLSNNAALSSTVTNGDCRPAFVYYGRDNNTKGGAAPFSNCSVSVTRVTLTLAAGVSYAAGDQVDIRFNQSVLLDAANTSVLLQPLASHLPVLPVLTSATLSAPGVLSVKLPFATAAGFAMNASICASTFELRGPGAAAAKPDPFASCTFSAETATLTLKGRSLLEQGDTVNIVDGQTNLVYDTAPYARAPVGLAVAPTIYSVSLTSATTVTIGTAAPVAPLEDGACNAIFELRLTNGTVPAAPFSGCVVAADKMSIIATFANGTSFAGGMRINVRGNQTALKAFSATGPLFTALANSLTIQPTILAATLTSATTIQVTLPVASTAGSLDQAACNAIFELRGVGLTAAKSTPFESCTVAANGLSMTLTLSSSSSYSAGDVLNVKSGQTQLQVGTTPYVPRAVPVLPTLVSAFLVSASTIHVQLPVASVLPAAFTPADCARTFLILPFNVTSPASAKPIASCSLTTDRTMVAVNLAPSTAFAAGDTINVVANQWQLRGGRSVTLGPAYVPAPRTAITITPVFSSAVLVSDASIVVTLPVPSTLAAGTDCNAAFSLLPSSGGTDNAKPSPFASCRLDATNTTLTFNLTLASSYSVGDVITPQSSNNRLTVGSVSYGFRTTTINPTLTSATLAVLTRPDTIRMTLPFDGYFSTNGGKINASVCNAAFDLVSASNTSKPSPFSDCTYSSPSDSNSQTYTYYATLTLATTSTYTAGDSLNIRPLNSFFSGNRALYVPGPRNVAIRPTITAATMVDGSSVYVTLSAPAKAFNTSVCNSMLEIGSNDLFDNCTLSADGRAITFGLKTADTVSAGTSINVKADQQVLVAAGSGANDSPAFVPLTTAITVTRAELIGAYLTSSTTIIGRLSVRAASSSGFQSSCNSVFIMARANGTARGDPFATCELSDDGLDVTLTLSSSVFESGDTLNMAFGQSLLSALTADSGPKYLNRTSPITIRPVLLSATAVGPNKVLVRLPLPTELSTASCGIAISITGSTPAKTVTSCELRTNGSTLTLTLDNSYSSTDRIDVASLQSIIRIVHPSSAGQGTTYGPKDSLPILPSVGDTYTTAANTLSVTLPGSTTTNPSPLTAEACNNAVGIFSSSSDSANSGAIASCVVSGSTMTVTLSSSYNAGDRINVLPLPEGADDVLSVGSTGYTPLATPATIKPTLISAKAISTSAIMVTLPVASIFLSADGKTSPATLDKADCDNVLQVMSGSAAQALAATKSCDLNYTTGATYRTLKVNLAADSNTYAPGMTVNVMIPGASKATLLAGSTKTGPAYQPALQAVPIQAAYVTSAIATAADTIVVTLPWSSSVFNNAGNAIDSPLTGAQCSEIVDIRGKAIASCTYSGTTFTVKLMGNGTDVYAGGDTFNFKDTATNAVLRAGSSSSSPAYKSLDEPLVITPLLVSAKLTQGDTIVVALPAASNSFWVSGNARTSLTDTQCSPILSFTKADGNAATYTLKSGDGACSVSGSTLTIKLSSNSTYTAGDKINIASVANGQKAFGAGSDSKGPYYGVSAADSTVMISVAYLTSAIARTADTIEVTFPYATSVAGAAPGSVSLANCNAMVEVLAQNVDGDTKTIEACTMTNVNMLSITLDDTKSTYAPGDTVRIKTGNTLLVTGSSSSNAAHTPSASATPITAGYITSAVAVSLKTLVITLPVPCTLTKSTITAVDCGNIIALGGSPGIDNCTLTSNTKLTVNLSPTDNAAVYAPATTTFDIKPTQSLLVVGSTTSGPLFAPLSGAQGVVPGYITSAVATAAKTILVTLPFAPTGASVDTCANRIEVKQANGTARAVASSSCAITGSTITVTTDTDLAAGDTVALKGTGITTTAGSRVYAAASTAISPGYIVSAAAIAVDTVMLTLPFESALSANPNCANVVYVGEYTDQVTSTDKSTSCALTLDTTGKFLSIKLAAGTVISASYKVKFANSPTALTASRVAYGAGADPVAVSGAPYVLAPTAVSSTQIEVQLTMPAVLSGTACTDVVTLSQTISSCSITGSNKDVLLVTLSAGYSATATLALAAGGGTTLTAGSASGTKFGSIAATMIRPTIVSAVATASNKVLVTLPVASTLWPNEAISCLNVFSVSTASTTGMACSDPAGTTTIELTLSGGAGYVGYSAGDTIQATDNQAAGTDTPLLRAGTTNLGALYTKRRPTSGGVTIQPTIASALLTGPFTITVPLPFASSLAITTTCNEVFALYPTGQNGVASAARATPFSACSLSADGKTVTLTLKAGSDYVPTDILNVRPSQTYLVAESATASKRTAYAPHPSGAVVAPTFVSAIATSTSQIVVQLPRPSFTDDNDMAWDCTTAAIAVVAAGVDPLTGTARAPATADACVLKGNVLIYTLKGDAVDNRFTAGDKITVRNGLALYVDNGKNVKYTARAVTIYDHQSTPANSLVSATLVSSSEVEVALPTMGYILSTATSCADYLAYTPNKISSCSMDSTYRTIKVTLSATGYAAGDTVNIAGNSQDKLVYATGTNTSPNTTAKFVPMAAGIPVRPTVVSAYTVDSKTIRVVLPAASSYIANNNNNFAQLTEGLTADDCASVLSWKPVNDGQALAASCSLPATTNSIVEVTVTASTGTYTAGDTINIAAANSNAAKSLRAVSDASNAIYTPRAIPVTISPRLVSALATSSKTVVVTLPAASAFFDATGTAVSRALTAEECKGVVSVFPASGSTAKSFATTSPCTLDGSTLTLQLADSFTPGDTVNVVNSASIVLRAGTTSAGPIYKASPAPMAIVIAYVSSAVWTSATTIDVTLPFASAIFSSSAKQSTLAKAMCDSVVSVFYDGTSAGALDNTKPCAFDTAGKVLTLTLASSVVLTSAAKLGWGAPGGTAYYLRADATSVDSVTTTSPVYYQAPTAFPLLQAVSISPAIWSAAAIAPSTIQMTLPYASKLMPDNSINRTECAGIVRFSTGKELLDAEDACAYSSSGSSFFLTVKLSGSGAAGAYAASDKVNMADSNSQAAATFALKAGSAGAGPAYVPAPSTVNPVDITIYPNLYTATIVSPTVLHVALPVASSLPEATAAQCEAIVVVSGSSSLTPIRSLKSCALDTDKTTLIVEALGDTGNVLVEGDYVNIKDAALADGSPALTAGTDGKGPIYKTRVSSLRARPSVMSARATSATTIKVTLPVASSFLNTASGNAVVTSLTAAECGKVLVVKSRSGTVRSMASSGACSLTGGEKEITITLAPGEAFAAGDTVNIADTNDNAVTNGATKVLFGGTTQKYAPRKEAVTVAPAYVTAAFALAPLKIAVQLAVTSFMASTTAVDDCAKVVTVYSLDSSNNEVPKTVDSCSVAQLSGNYFLVVNTLSAYQSGDRVYIKATNKEATAPLRGGSDASGISYEASSSVAILPNINTAVLVDASTIHISFAGSISGLSSSNSKPTCDAAFVFGNGDGNRTSPIQSCTTDIIANQYVVVITIDPENPYQAGDWVNIRKDQTTLRVSSATAVNMPHNTIINPRPYGASATLTSPTSIAVPLPATSSVTDSSAAACNSALAIASVGAGTTTAASTSTSAGPIASCSIANDRILNVNLATASYLAGDTINVASPTQSVLLYGVPPSAAPYFPAADPLPILTTIDRATLIDPTTVVLSLPAASAVPANLTADDCMRAIAMSSTSGEAKNGSVASCTLSPDRMSLTVALKDAASYAPSDKVNVRQGQAELRVAAMDVGTGYVPKALDQVINPALFSAKAAVLSAPTTITATLPFASALKDGTCPVVLSPGAKAAASCALAADGVTLTLTLGEARYTAGDVLQVPSNQSGLTLADGTTLYVPSAAGIPIVPTAMSAVRIGDSTISVTLPTASVVVASTSDACSATVSIASAAGAEYNAPVATCAVDASGTTLALTLAANYAPATGDTLNIKDGQTNLRAGSASGPAYVPAAARLPVAFPSPPPPSPSPPPPPAPTVSDLPARGLSSGYLECSASVGSSVSNTASNVATDMGSFTIKTENNVDTVRFRDAACRDSYTGATVLDSTVSSHVLYGMDGLVVSPATGLARAASPPSVSATTFAGMVTTVLKNLGLPVEKYTTPLHKYDYYQTTFVNASVSGAAVANLQGMISSNVKLFASWFDGLNATLVGKDLSASEAVPVAQLSMAAALLNSTTDLTRNTTVLALLRTAYTAVTGAAAPVAHRRRLLQAPFSSVEGSAAALSQAVAESNKIIADQQAIVLRALTTGQPLSEAELRAAIAAATQAITMQSTSLAAAAQALANGTLSVDQFKSEYTGDALLRKIAETQVPGASGSPGGSGQPQGGDDDKDNKALIIGLVVGLVGGAIVIGVIVAVIVMRRRKQQIVANKGPAGAGEV